VWTSRVKSLLAKAGLGVHRLRNRYVQDGLCSVHPAEFRSDPAFRAAYNRGVQASHGVDPQFEWRVHTSLWAAQTALRVPGDFVECGVNAGFMSSAIMRYLNWNAVARRFYLIDTFAGPVLSQFSQEEVRKERLTIAEDALQAGAYVTDLERIRANFDEWPNAFLLQGAVPDILPSLGIETVAFLHIDMNCAMPERAALEFFWDRLSPGAVVLLDDYAYCGHECQREAIDEAARAKDVQVLSLPTGQGLIIK
jgi:Macrocin-O-methyltransferase (TylF)